MNLSLKPGEPHFLTESFRFGDEIAAAANRLLAVKRELNPVRGGRRVSPSSTKACIARGNAALYRRAAHLAHQGGNVCWVGGIDGYRLDLLNDIWLLKAGRRSDIKDRFVARFEDFDALQGYANAQDERDLKAWIRVIEGHSRWQAIPEEIALVRSRSVAQPEGAALALATAHKSKGLEFGSVELADDFPEAELANAVKYSRESHPLFWDEQGFRGGVLLLQEEINLRYVAITRAETTCTSGQWPAPMFNGLADYIRRHPRFLTLEDVKDGPPAVEPRPVEPQPEAVADVEAVVRAYARSYPLLRWDLLAQRWQQGATDLSALLMGHPLQSARMLVAAFVEALSACGDAEAAPEEDPTPAPEAFTPPEQEPSNPALPDLISADYGLAPVVMEERFNSTGWSEVGRVQLACPRCATKPLAAFNRPRKAQTLDQWYRQDWALFCPNCALLHEAADVQKLRLQKPHLGRPAVVAVIRAARP